MIVPHLIREPVGIKIIDDMVLFINSQKGMAVASSLVVAFVTYLALKV